MMKWLIFSAVAGSVALFGSCERHSPEALNKMPGHHESHGEGAHEEEHGEHAEPAAAPHAAEHAPAAAAPKADTTPPKYFH